MLTCTVSRFAKHGCGKEMERKYVCVCACACIGTCACMHSCMHVCVSQSMCVCVCGYAYRDCAGHGKLENTRTF